MAYEVLARKWRPHTFDEMMGQEHVLQALMNALDNDRLHHAYLFTGTRGVGKTTIGRILAKCLNCEKGVSAKPCGECSACTEVSEGRFIDLIEVDAASRTKVEDTRELLDNVQYAPTRGRFKVYLIDEVHMLSGHSFNALLKTLEEPPPHVKFLLATTDPQKLPVTVLSRCLQFNLKNMLPEQIVKHLQHILAEEKIEFEDQALWQLGRAADGSMRDALSLLDQAIAFGSGKVVDKDVRAMLGTIEQTHLFDILHALSIKDGNTITEKVNQLAELAVDFNHGLADMLSILHKVALLQAIPEGLDKNQDHFEQIKQLAGSVSPEDVQLFYQIALIGRRDLYLAPSPKIGFEMILLRMLAFQPATSGQAPTPATNSGQQQTKHVPAPKPTTTETSVKAEITTKAVSADTDWQTILSHLSLTGITQALAANCVLQEMTDTTLNLLLSPDQSPLLSRGQEDRLSKAVSQYFGKEMKVSITVARTDIPTPAHLAKQTRNARQLAAEQSIENDPNVQAIIDKFDGIIAPGSIKPIKTPINNEVTA